jgi:hypothetical protein
MDTRDNGGPAFAALATSGMGDVHHQEGMSLRDWYAGQMIPAAFAFAIELPSTKADPCPTAARLAYGMADAMLAERSKGGA